MPVKKFSIINRLLSFKHAFKGLKELLIQEHNARVHLFATIVILIASIYFQISLIEWSLIILSIMLVFITELINTSIERLSDIVDPTWNKKIGLVKDYTAAAVFCSSLFSLIIGLSFLFQKF